MTMLRPALLTALAVAVDLATKALARHILVPGASIDLLPGMSLGLSYNSGMAFGLLQGQRWPLLVVGAAIAAGLVFWLRRERSGQSRVGLSLVLGGALGNLIDRLARGTVTDFIDLHAFDLQWPTFNLADTALTLGVLLLLFDRHKRSEATAT
jgi:signal peptidase II